MRKKKTKKKKLESELTGVLLCRDFLNVHFSKNRRTKRKLTMQDQLLGVQPL